MPTYRLYTLDRYSGHFTGVEELHADDDAGAIGMAHEREAQAPHELWIGSRKVSRFDARAEMAGYPPLRRTNGR
jgi:hypothetical protein